MSSLSSEMGGKNTVKQEIVQLLSTRLFVFKYFEIFNFFFFFFIQMVYMVVEKHTPDLLDLKRSPGIRSWSLFVGMIEGKLTLCKRTAYSLYMTLDVLHFFIQG